METVTAIRRHHPRTANDPSRLITTTLLLLGGAFVLGLMWFVRYEHLLLDRVTPYVPDSADAVLSLPLDERSFSVLSAFKGDFGRALSSIRFQDGKMLVLFVDKNVDNGDESWYLLTDAEVDGAMLPLDMKVGNIGPVHLISPSESRLDLMASHKASLRIFRRGTGTGFIATTLSRGQNANQKLPMRLSIFKAGVKLEIGHQFRGLNKKNETSEENRRVTFLPENTEAYAILPAGQPLPIPENYELEGTLTSIAHIPELTTEIVLSKDGHFAALLHGTEGATKLEAIEQPVLDELTTLTPTEVPTRLPDGSKMIELRLNKGDVELKEKELPNNVLLRQYRSEDGRKRSLIIYPDGQLWVTDDTELVSSLLLSTVGTELKDTECQPSFSAPGFVFTREHAQTIPDLKPEIRRVLSEFKVDALRFEDKETGLFTFCGYF